MQILRNLAPLLPTHSLAHLLPTHLLAPLAPLAPLGVKNIFGRFLVSILVQV